ncbi:PadR family transcriptional regulator [uncultured Microbacterium sp.]|uniref:PadR family transcriptional regulator n=1 Tax=uncultured Microbacterium sp. TaxID=191216 RepID=UPI0028D1C603|nr:PadR family transcriptional regulator [uncultured Microbacterium sp.]
MSVRQSLLAILGQGPCYGYQLRAEFERRTGSMWPLNVGQIYNTLDRLERDGLVSKGATDEHGHVFYTITDAGAREVLAWLGSPVERGQTTRDELAIKLAVAATLPGADIAAVIGAQRAASRASLDALTRRPRLIAETGPEALARAVVIDAMIAHTEADLRWLDHTERRLSTQPPQAMTLAPAADRPKRGRPAKAPAA